MLLIFRYDLKNTNPVSIFRPLNINNPSSPSNFAKTTSARPLNGSLNHETLTVAAEAERKRRAAEAV